MFKSSYTRVIKRILTHWNFLFEKGTSWNVRWDENITINFSTRHTSYTVIIITDMQSHTIHSKFISVFDQIYIVFNPFRLYVDLWCIIINHIPCTYTTSIWDIYMPTFRYIRCKLSANVSSYIISLHAHYVSPKGVKMVPGYSWWDSWNHHQLYYIKHITTNM